MDELELEHQQPSTVREGNTRLVWATASSSWNSIANTKIYTHTQCAEHPCKPCLSPAAIFPFCFRVQWDMNCLSLDSEKSALWSGSWMELPTLRHHIASIPLHLWGHNLLLSHFPTEPVTEFLLFFFSFESAQYYFMIYMTVDKITASLCSHLLNSIITLPLQNCHEESAHSCAW